MKRRLMWAGPAWRKEGSLIKTVINEDPIGKRPLGRPRLRWEDRVKKAVKVVEPNISWRETAANLIEGLVLKAETHKKKNVFIIVICIWSDRENVRFQDAPSK